MRLNYNGGVIMELERIGFYNFFEKQTLQDGKGRVAAVYKDRKKIN